MKNFGFLFCCLLCVLPCVFTTRHPATEEELVVLSKSMGITRQDFQECLDKAGTDWDTMAELSDSVLGMGDLAPQDAATKVSCFGACIYKKNGMMVNSKIVADKVIEIATRATSRPEVLPEVSQKIRTCSKRVSGSNDCEITLSFSRCVIDEMNRNG